MAGAGFQEPWPLSSLQGEAGRRGAWGVEQTLAPQPSSHCIPARHPATGPTSACCLLGAQTECSPFPLVPSFPPHLHGEVTKFSQKGNRLRGHGNCLSRW